MTKNIPKRFREIKWGKRDRAVIKQGNSFVITIPVSIVDMEGVKRGDRIKIFSDGDGSILVNLRPEAE